MDIFELLAWVMGPIVSIMLIYFGIMGLLKGKTVGLFRFFYHTIPSDKMNNKIAARIFGIFYLTIGVGGILYMVRLLIEFVTTGNLPHVLDY